MSLLFFILGSLIVTMPFIPTLVELFKKTDSKPLKISDHILKDPRSNTGHVFWHFANLIGLENVADIAGKIATQNPFFITPTSWVVPFGLLPTPPKGTARVVSSGDLELSPKTRYLTKILSLKSIRTARDNALHEVHARENLTLADRARVIWWASGQDIEIHDQCHLPGKTEAKGEIRLLGNVWFHLLEAPSICSKNLTPKTFLMKQPPQAEELRTVIQGDYVVEAGTALHSTLIVRGRLLISEGAKVFGNVKCHKDFILAPGAQVFGNIVGKENGTLQGGNFVGGSLLTQKTLKIGPTSQIGTPDHLVTLSALTLRISGPFQAHGVIRAWKMGHFTP